MKRAAGLPYQGSRPLSGEEREFLTGRARRSRAQRIGWGCGTGLMSIVLLVALAILAAPEMGWIAQALLLVPLVATLTFVPLKWHDANDVSRLAREASGATDVQIFQGHGQEMEVLHPSAVAIRFNGELVRSLVRVRVTETAEAPAPDPFFPHRTSGREGDRGLSSTESLELESWLQSHRYPLTLWQSLGGAYILFGVVALSINGDRKWYQSLQLVAMAGYVALFAFVFVNHFAMRRRLNLDLAEGVVRKMPDGTEVLPNSGRIWRIEGEPALWRGK